MSAETYILGMGCISPAGTFQNLDSPPSIPDPALERLNCIEPDYATFIDSRQIRRMSRIIRMGVCAASMAVKNAKDCRPDSIVVGTSLGCLEDTDSFLSSLIRYNEDMLSPSAFIHSTHNTIASQIGLFFKCHGYNSTYVHREISFESALIDGLLLLDESPSDKILVGSADELIDNSYVIQKRLGKFRNNNPSETEPVYKAGEGAAFFVLSREESLDSLARISFCETIYNADEHTATEKLLTLMQAVGVSKPTYVLAGRNGVPENDALVDRLLAHISIETPVYPYKRFCGDYGSSSAFACWLACTMLNKQIAPDKDFEARNLESILVLNASASGHISFMLLKK